MRISDKYRINKKACFVSLGIYFGIGIFLNLILIVQQLTNHFDGLWSNPFFIAGSWEISIGRWFWPVLDWLRMGYAADPFNSYLTILFFACGNLLITDIFSISGTGKAYLFNAMIFSSTTLSVFLSYRYMSPTYGLSYLLGVFAVWILYRKITWKNASLSVMSICLMLGLYQANVGCTCFLTIALLLTMCLEQKDNKSIIEFVFSMGFSIIVACMLYKVVWDIVLKIFHISADAYNGAANVSIMLILKRLPTQVLEAYSKFYTYFFKNTFRHNIFQKPYIYAAIILLLLLVLLCQGYILLKQNAWIRLAVYLTGIIVIPVACNVSVLLAPEAGFLIQQTCGMAIFLPIMLCLLDRGFQDMKNNKWIKRIIVGIAVFILYGNIYMTALDQEVMYEGKIATETVMDHVIQTLIDKNLCDDNRQYFFVGQISANPMFKTTSLWNRANSYAHYGEFWTNAKSIRMSYDGVLRNIGIELKIGPDELYEQYVSEEFVADMPVYPAEGSVLDIGGVCGCKDFKCLLRM